MGACHLFEGFAPYRTRMGITTIATRGRVRGLAICLLAVVITACGVQGAGTPQATISGATPTPQPLPSGTHRMDLNAIAAGAAEFPPFLITVPEGWVKSNGWIVNRPNGQDAIPPVAVQFWDVDEVYAHPCQWKGTLFQPGPSVDDLVQTLAEIPTRNATAPSSVTIGGYSGMYLEWSVPADLEVIGDGQFPACDANGEGNRDFLSWTGKGWGTDRFHQGAGQIDQLWILDVEGSRLVIDAFSMPYATDEERDEIAAVVESITFE